MRQLVMMLGIVLLSASLYAQSKDDRKKSGSDAVVATLYPEGIVYSLPRTGIRIQVVAEKELRISGPYAQYAQKYLGIGNAPSSNIEKWEIKHIGLENFSEPDPAQVYKATGVNASLLNLTGAGVIAGINSETEIRKELVSVSNFVTEKLAPDFPFTDLSMWGMFAKATEAEKYRLSPKSLEEKAAEAAETIFTLRNSRFRLFTNADDEPLPDGKAFEVMAKELGDLEQEQLALFIGKSVKKTYQYAFDFIPGDSDVKGEVVFRFSEDKGVLPKTDLAGKPVIIDITKEADLESQQKKQLEPQNPAPGQSKIYYRLPGKAAISLSDGMNMLAATRVTIAQFGTVAPLPETLLNGNYRIAFHPETGAIKSVVPANSK
ncbi:MAG: hypothetical protein A2W90_12260 [Bacteroidetes bacterium GWF2_42_66]|nr:MAG: hypothetical protein A2W92_23165 [Bacteroidetes bacterium GWA2_42_15]OFX99960.1 MAG: hypothetical protein A2W89_17245 [Bacteroidetes bacterium GWE2_42_39]OFY40145.1 MAG: hypothetical protein A2W90_12260 [Bacteroidetes bacterium GWF2_42_66]HBL73973.1 hypothetical protein [Prolixibacteraceae bacterium]HCR89216.1 hypothetical protein [Prolixibacteraceae bacterium]